MNVAMGSGMIGEQILGTGGEMSDNSDNSASPVSADTVGSADPTSQTDPISPAEARSASDSGKGSGDARNPGREDPWNTFQFRRAGGLEGRAPSKPAEPHEQDAAG